MKTGDDTHEGGKLTQLRRLFPVVVCVWCAGLVGCCGLRGGGPAGTCSGVAVAREVASSVVARPAPGFTAAAVSPEDTFVEVSLDDYQGQYILLAFYPGDFTFVSVEEALRTLDAIRFTDEHDEVCPADWEDGDDAVVPTREGVIRFLSEPGSPE